MVCAVTDESTYAERAALAAVRNVIVDGSCAALSFDVFDTVLWRRVPRPSDVFELLGARLRGAGMCPGWLTDVSFRRMRVEAEQVARAVREDWGREVSLADIWRAMPLTLFEGATVEELVDAEVAIEREFTVVDLDIAELVQLAGKHDVPLVLVSDTYFTESQLTHLLDRPELKELSDARVFRSHQHGTDKATGLWEVVLSDLGLQPEQLVHVGDNEVADMEVPTQLGIRTVPYARVDDTFAEVLRREGEPDDAFEPARSSPDTVEGDFGLTSLRAKVLQCAETNEVAWRYGAGVIGPVLTGFAEWAAWQAEQAGIDVLWCPMREGELLSELVNNAAQARGWAVQAKPVWLSRHVTSLGNLARIDLGAVHHFIRRSHRLTVRQLLQLLHLRPGELPSLATHLDTVLDNGIIIDQVAAALTETPHMRHRLAASVTAARERLLTSLRACGALDSGEMMLVDLGWGGTIQRQLHELLQQAQVDIRVSGLYLATDKRSTGLLRAGLRAQGYLGQSAHPEIARLLARSPEVLEQCVTALCGSLVDFTVDGQPVLGPRAESTEQERQRRAVQTGIRAFQVQWNRYVDHTEGRWPELAGAGQQLGEVLAAALKAPTAEEAALFGPWVHEDNFGSQVTTTLIPDDLTAALPYFSPGDLDELHMRDAFWPRLLAQSEPYLRATTHALDSGLLDPAVFEPAGNPSYTKLRWRSDDGEWHDDGPRSRVRINHNGLSFARLNIEACGVLDVTLAIPGRPALARIDWIEAKVLAGGNPVPTVLRWETPEELAELPLMECVWLGGKFVEFESAHSAVLLPLAARVGAPVTSAQVSVAFAVLPRSETRLEPRVPPAERMIRLAGRARAEYRARGLTGLADGARRIATRKIAGHA